MNAVNGHLTPKQTWEVRKYFGSQEWRNIKQDYEDSIQTLRDEISNSDSFERAINLCRTDIYETAYQEGIWFKSRFNCPLMYDVVDAGTNDKELNFRFNVHSPDTIEFSANDIRRYKIKLFQFFISLENGFIWHEEDKDYDITDRSWQEPTMWDNVPKIDS